MAPHELVNILLVDDQPAKLMTLEAILGELNENIVTANSADAALKLLLSQEFAVVLVDVCMPKMDGFELAELIRNHPRFNRTAVIFISGVYLSDADRLRGYLLGAVDYMPVPIIPEVLRAKVAVFAELYRKTRELHRVNTELAQRVVELKQSNERLRIADHMATIGTLVAGLGHDIGNLLLPVRMHIDMLLSSDISDDARTDVNAIREATDYMQRLARSLRLLAFDPQKDGPSLQSTDLTHWWQESEGLLRGVVRKSVELVADIPAGLPLINISLAALTQVVFNLVLNANDALKGTTNGRVSIVASASSTEVVRIVVSDNGPGMTEEALRRCMEPFFSTKTRELSTGLGLALVNGLIKRSGGIIKIESSPGNGAVFTIDLPVASSQSTKVLGSHRVACVALSDSRLGAHVRTILTGLKYEVTSTHDPKHDVWVVDGNGTYAIAKASIETNPSRKVIVFSHNDDLASHEAHIYRIDPDTKPSVLRDRIRHLLTGPLTALDKIA